jgi:hypothetical protein
MAQRTPRSGSRAAPRAAAKSRKPATSGVEVVEEAAGIGIDAGIAIITAVVLVAAVILVDMMQATNGDGFLF